MGKTCVCLNCGKEPHVINKYVEMGMIEDMAPLEFAQSCEGDLSRRQ